ncbi:hypothetical protein PVAND_013338 [Polypedilum vanderplanki]|uniref:SLC26A/SulP transporter domain-containing protein n=1 Tax=Polypedilum vanderplanki TaxID=319348 RepID=A0A9J6CPE0_POLVA|nr:hypothetical protein PVAND_013338 [Polypedilum vanderplanki]
MAFGMLAGVDPIVGLYMAFFPTLIHCIFGTSKHISMGTFAVISIATSKLTTKFSDSNYEMRNLTNNSTVDSLPHYHYSTAQISSALTLVCGFYQLLMCIFKLGFLHRFFLNHF